MSDWTPEKIAMVRERHRNDVRKYNLAGEFMSALDEIERLRAERERRAQLLREAADAIEYVPYHAMGFATVDGKFGSRQAMLAARIRAELEGKP